MPKKLYSLFILLFLIGCSRFGGNETPGAASGTPDMGQTPNAASTVQPTFTLESQPSPTPIGIRGTLTIWHSWGEEQIPALEQILENFSAQYPEVLFDVLYIPQENLLTRFEGAVQENAGPDLLLGPAEWGPALYRAGMIQDLGDMAEGGLLSTINPAALAAGRDHDVLVGLPYAQQGVVLYRNKALIDRSAATLDELLAMAKAATQGEIIGADLEQGLLLQRCTSRRYRWKTG